MAPKETRPPWQPPASMDEALERCNTLLAAKQDIEAQLGNDWPRQRIDGTYFTPAEQDHWRSSAKTAKAHIEDDYRRTKQWIKQQDVPDERLRRLRWIARNLLAASADTTDEGHIRFNAELQALREELAS